ncbi:hypothetical protein PO909_017866 [Leuciscus waleckii]
MCIRRSVTAAYHPQTNGLDEKTNDNIKRALEKLVNDQQNDWDVYLDATLFSLRSKVHTTTQHSPFLLMYGREVVFPAEVPVEMPRDEAKKQAEENIAKQKEAYAKKAQKNYKDLIYNVGDEVLLMNTRKCGRKGGRIEPDFSGPYIIERLSGKLVTLNKPGGITLKTKYSIGHIKPYRRSQTGKVPDECSGISVSSGSTENNSSFKIPPCTVAPTLSPQHSVTKVNDSEKLQEDSALQRPSVIQVSPKMLDQTNGYIEEVKLTPTDEEPAIKFPSDVKQISEEQGFIFKEISFHP